MGGRIIRINLCGLGLTDISPLAGLVALEAIFLFHNQLTDITPLAGLVALESLFLSNNQLTDISPLAGLTGLEWLPMFDHTSMSQQMGYPRFPTAGFWRAGYRGTANLE